MLTTERTPAPARDPGAVVAEEGGGPVGVERADADHRRLGVHEVLRADRARLALARGERRLEVGCERRGVERSRVATSLPAETTTATPWRASAERHCPKGPSNTLSSGRSW